MKRFITVMGLTISLFSSGSGGGHLSIKVESPAFSYGDFIPIKYTCDSLDISPPIRWSNVPENTRSFVIIMDDPDAPIGTFTHWVVYDIPADKTSLPEDFPKEKQVGEIKQGVNDFRRIGYGGPCPPPGKPHRYFFKVYALDIDSLGLPPGATRKQVEERINGHIIAKGELMGRYGR